MIDIAAFTLTSLVAVALALVVVRRVAGAPATRGRAWLRRIVCVALGLGATMYGTYLLGRARSVQLFGEVVPRVTTDERVVALTFDDGPTPEATGRVLEMLEAEGVRATFYLIGREIEANPGQARMIAAAGHEIGNHTWTHDRMVGLPLDRIADELARTDSAIRRTGYTGPIDVRSPYCWKLAAFPWHLRSTGRRNVTFDVEPESHADVDGDSARIVRHVLETTRPGSIILLHVMYPSRAASLAAVPAIIAGLQERGYRFVTVQELIASGREEPSPRSDR